VAARPEFFIVRPYLGEDCHALGTLIKNLLRIKIDQANVLHAGLLLLSTCRCARAGFDMPTIFSSTVETTYLATTKVGHTFNRKQELSAMVDHTYIPVADMACCDLLPTVLSALRLGQAMPFPPYRNNMEAVFRQSRTDDGGHQKRDRSNRCPEH